MGFKNSLKGLSIRAKVLVSFFGPFFIGLLCYVLLSYLNYSSSTSLDFSQSYKNIQEAYYYCNDYLFNININISWCFSWNNV